MTGQQETARPGDDPCEAHGKQRFGRVAAETAVSVINARAGARRVKAYFSSECGAWHVSVARGGGAQERRRQRRASSEEGR